MRKVVAYLASAFFFTALTIAPANAHSELLSINPAEDSISTSAPTKVVLTFSEKISPVGYGLTVTAPDGARVDLGAPKVVNATLSVNLGPLSLNGHYTVNYRVVSADGHPVEESSGFYILIPALAATAKAKIEVKGEGETGIDRGEGRSSGAENLATALYILGGVLLGGAGLYWYRRRHNR